MSPDERIATPPPLPAREIDPVLRRALEEDVGGGDVTTETLIRPDLRARGRLLAKAEGVVCGLDVFARVFTLLEEGAVALAHARDGDAMGPGDRLLEVTATARTLLVGERTALNFLQRMSGVATLTRAYVRAADGGARVLDTRKTTPGLRALEKYAVRCGGAESHRFGLFDEAMVKNNHVDLAGETIGSMIGRLRSVHGAALRITAEARDEAEALTAVQGGADVVMLDNMSVPAMQALCPRLRALADDEGKRIEIEASGGVTLERMAAVAASGVDRVSVGALTHSYDALDLSFRIEVLA